ncbi:MAG TPA: GH1 family beta-glucosidase [Steroidobacteraceae bacterium]|nr:GH1 family beta-glucosidase [Steroidobacteraceae bacterium]
MSLHPSIAELRRRFPSHFVWGAATSAFQIEGAARADGKGPSIWDEFCRSPGAIADGSNGDVACDHYHRLESDLDLIAELGVNAYRFSISWPRVQPAGSGAVNEAGLAFYNRLVDGLLERNIQPYATLYHWDLPAELQHRGGGWLSRDTAERFADYARIVAERLGDRVVSFATHNEPWVTAVLGHERGIFAPGVKDRRVAYQVSHHVLVSHSLAMAAIRSTRSRAAVGIVLNMSPVYPATDSDLDAAHAKLEDGRLVRWYMDAIFKGRYPADILDHLGAHAPQVRPGDAALIAEPLDFLGVNYYHPTVSSSLISASPASSGASVTDMGWEVAPHGLGELLLRLNRDYRLPPVFITENGAAYQDQVIGDRVEDEARRQYIESHLIAVADAIQRGVDVRGYFVWSLMDNFEWAEGFSKRFGIVHVDYATLRRTLKSSALWYQSLLRPTA